MAEVSASASPQTSAQRVVVVGAGHAGGAVVAFLRQMGHADDIQLIGDEPALPYQRPPLSKAWLKGDVDLNGVLLRPQAWYEKNRVRWRGTTRVQQIERATCELVLDDGERVPYDVLVLATGSRARTLDVPGHDLPGVLALRSFADAQVLKEHLRPGARMVVVGGGYVGLEAAASARALGADVILVERESRCLARVACEPLSTFFQDYHRAHGVEIMTDAGVAGFQANAEGRLAAVQLVDGRTLACDVALVGVGAIANDGLAGEAGLACGDGIQVDIDARTSDPAIYAIGDATWRPLPLYENRRFRLESVPNALEQARRAACAIVGRAAPPDEVPWFWSDQFDLKLQIAGLPFDADNIVIRGDPAAAKFAVFHLHGARLRAVEAVNCVPEFMVGKQLIASAQTVDREHLADSGYAMKSLIAD